MVRVKEEIEERHKWMKRRRQRQRKGRRRLREGMCVNGNKLKVDTDITFLENISHIIQHEYSHEEKIPVGKKSEIYNSLHFIVILQVLKVFMV